MVAWHRVAAISTHHNGVVCRLFVGQTEPGSLYILQNGLLFAFSSEVFVWLVSLKVFCLFHTCISCERLSNV